jgi:small subunit ribosomal protein S4
MWYNKYKLFDQNCYSVAEYPKKGNQFNKKYRNVLQNVRAIKLFYGGFLKKYFKKKLVLAKKFHKRHIKNNLKTLFLKHLESRLDTVLYRAKFCLSIKSARQFISHGKVLVNKRLTTCKSFELKPGDLIEIKGSAKEYFAKQYNDKTIEKNFKELPLPHLPNYLFVNYKTLQIIFGEITQTTNFSNKFTFSLKLDKILLNFNKK